MAFVVGTNSYISVVDAKAYFDERLYAEAWTDLEKDSENEVVLVYAYKILDVSFDWLYDKTDEDQEQEFPRNEEIVVPQNIKDAQCEIALLLLNTEADLVVPDKEMTEKNITIVTNKTSAFTDYILNLIQPYGREKKASTMRQAHTINVLR